MIYEIPERDAPIRQGDIFRGVPRIDVELNDLTVVDADQQARPSTWQSAIDAAPDAPIVAVVAMRPVVAIVITQDCDAVRSPEIALCEVGNFRAVEGRSANTTSPKAWVSILTQHARVNQKWYYLPPHDGMGFADKMAVDFRTVLRVGRVDIDEMRQTYRVGRLNDVALAHFRERVGAFFRRYPYDEWYPLDRDELAAYKADKVEPTEPYPWQI